MTAAADLFVSYCKSIHGLLKVIFTPANSSASLRVFFIVLLLFYLRLFESGFF